MTVHTVKNRNYEDINAQKLLEEQDKRVKGGHSQALHKLQSQSDNFKNGIIHLRNRVKGISAYPQIS